MPTASHIPIPKTCSQEKLSFDRPLTAQQQQGLISYIDILLHWNKTINLVGKSSRENIARELVQDSFELADFLSLLALPDFPRTLDLGAGAGLPGIPLRMLWDAGEYTLVESRGKRAAFLRYALAHLPLLQKTRTQVLHARTESLRSPFIPADIIVSRAFMPWPELLSCVGPFVAVRGRVLVMATTSAPEDIQDVVSGPAVWTLESSHEYTVSAIASGKISRKKRFLWSVQKSE